MPNLSALKKRIKKNEGFRNCAYLDILGFMTIGYGHLIKHKEKNFLKGSFSKNYLSDIFEKDFSNAYKNYLSLYKKHNHSQNIKEALIEMIFQIGIDNQKKFIKMNKYLRNNQIFMVALEMKNSLWYKQTPKRVDGLIKILLKKKYEQRK